MQNYVEQLILSNHSRIPLISGTILILAIFIVTCFPHFEYNHKRIVEIITILIILLTGTLARTSHCPQLGKLAFVPTILLFIAILSCILASSPKYAAIEAITFIGLTIICFQIAPSWESRHFCIFAGIALSMIMLITLIIFFTSYLAFLTYDTKFSIHDFFPAYANVRFFNQFQIWTMPFISLLLIKLKYISTNKLYKYIAWIIAILWWCIFFSTESRGMTAATILAYIITHSILKTKEKKLLKITIAISLCGFIAYKTILYFIPGIINNNSELLYAFEIRNTTNDRIILWRKAYNIIIENPILGIGPMHYAWFDNSLVSGPNKINHPHNSILQWGAEWGIASLSIILMTLFYSIKQWIKKNRLSVRQDLKNKPAEQAIAVTISIISAAIYSLVSGIIVMPTSQLTAIAPISMMVYLYTPHRTRCLTNKNYILFIIIVSATYLYLLTPDILSIIDKDNEIVKLYLHNPRFWLEGNIYYR